jgi:hypothetical protein
MITFKKYIILKENSVKTPSELSSMSPEDFANYLDSLLVGIKNKDRFTEITDSVIFDANNDYSGNNYLGTQLWEARRIISKIPPNALKFKKVTSDNTINLHYEFEYVANVDGVPYGLNKWEDPDYDPYGEREDDDESDDEDGGSKKTKGNLKYVWAYQRIGTNNDMVETAYNIGYGDEDVMKEMRQDLEMSGYN